MSAGTDSFRCQEKMPTNLLSIRRKQETALYTPFSQLHNRMLLWYSSGRTNWLALLDQGFQLAPTGVEIACRMFGAGLYFYDDIGRVR
jgi:hypothetical protein